MTAISLRALPHRHEVAGEQLEAVGLSLRKEGIAVLAVLLFIAALILLDAWRAAHAGPPTVVHTARGTVTYARGEPGFMFGPAAAIPMALLGFLLPYGVWGNGDPGSRRYMRSLPVPDFEHAVMRLASGWVWLMAAVAVYLLWIELVSLAVGIIVGHRNDSRVFAWVWLVPFTSATVAYLLGSIAVVGTRHPIRWVSGVILGWLALAFMLEVNQVGVGSSWAELIMTGEYGLATAVFGDFSHVARSFTPRGVGFVTVTDSTRWLIATLLWGIPALGAVLIMASRPRDD